MLLYIQVKKKKGENNMFISVKSLAATIDQDIQFYIEGMASKDQHSRDEFEKWRKYITRRLVKQLAELKRISSNQKMICAYEVKINDLLKS